MANKIERDIFVLRDATCVAQPIEYMQGTNAVPILLHVRDFNILENSTARVYVEWPSTKGEYDNARIEGNDVIIDVKDTMFPEVGKCYLQICITNDEDTLVTFCYPVVVKQNKVPGITEPSKNRSDFLDEYLKNIENKIEITTQQMEHTAELELASRENAEAAENSANITKTYVQTVEEKASLTEQYSIMAESFTHGGTGVRENEAVDNAQYFLEQAKQISQSMNGLVPMGTIAFEDLSLVANQVKGYMFNISDDFTTDSTFKEGAGYKFPAGTNVFRTNDGYWDCLAGSFQTPNGDTKDNTTAFVQATTRTNIVSGEKHSIIFGKIAKWFSDLKTIAFSGSYNDLSDKPTIPDAVAVKGNKETTYRTGNVNLTPANIGAVAVGGNTATNTVTYTSADSKEVTEWTDVEILVTGEKHSSIFNKISTMFKNIRYLYKMFTELNSDLGNKASKSTTLAGYGITDAQKKLTPVLFQATPWNVTMKKNVCYKYGNLCYVFVEFQSSSDLPDNTSLFSLPYKPLGLYEVSAPYLRYLNNNKTEETMYDSTYGVVATKWGILANKPYVFEWVYLTE